MFDRSATSYAIPVTLIDNILKDNINPLNQISELIEDGSKILDIGAGNGLLSQLFLRKKKNVYIDGIEPNHSAAAIAKEYYQNFYIGYAEDFTKSIKWDQYDYIIMADVIEHLVNPTILLTHIRKNIPNSTKIILSVPNIAFGAVRISLMNGNFKYVDSGLLEKTHVRFFTLSTLIELVNNLDMNIEQLIYLQKSIFNSEIVIKKTIKNYILRIFLLNDETAFTYQFIVQLSKNSCKTNVLRLGSKY